MKIWLTRDPETERIALLDQEPGDANFPRGKRGRGWEVRTGVLDEGTWDDLMAGRLSNEVQDVVHQRAWQEASQ